MLLSPTTSYYIRKLLRQNAHNLKWVVHPRAGIQADAIGNIDEVICSLYLEESEISAVIINLENLVAYHQALTSQNIVHDKEIAKAEETIFWLLGFKLKVSGSSNRSDSSHRSAFHSMSESLDPPSSISFSY